MDIRVAELGNRPKTWTKARRFAPAGAHELGRLLGMQPFADFGFVVIDWENKTEQQHADIAKPVIFVQVHKLLPEFETKNHLIVESRLDIEDIFGGDNMTAESILDIVRDINMKVDEAIAKRRGEAN